MLGAAKPLILGYHAVSERWPSPLAITPTLLHDQLSHLLRRGYVGLTLSEAERRHAAGTLPARALVVTFDDGYASTLLAHRVLSELGTPGTVFVVTGFVDSSEPLSWHGVEEPPGSPWKDELRPLGWHDLETLAEAGWEIGSHTVTHPLLTAADDERLRRELEGSRAAILDRLGRCESLAYPYGVADGRVAAAAARSGYAVACTLTFTHLADEPLRRPRIGLSAADTGMRLRLQVSTVGRLARRGPPARLARRLHGRRSWLPSGAA